MHKNIFPLLVVLLGIVTAYTFYAVWHSDELEENNPVQQISKELSQTEPTEKKHIKSPLSKSNTVKTTPSLIAAQNKIKAVEKPNVSSMVLETPKQTQEVYESLIPENYDEINEQSSTAFSTLDATVLNMQEHLDTEMQNINTEEEYLLQ